MDDSIRMAAVKGGNVLSEWHSGEDLDEIHNELLSQLTAMSHISTLQAYHDQDMFSAINTIKCAIVAAYQIGRASARGEENV